MSLRSEYFVGSVRQGFTLVELLVSISIMVAVAMLALSGSPQAIIRASLSDDTYQVELLLRRAQLEGGAINSLDNTFGGVGAFFNKASTTQILKFKDKVDPSIVRAIGIGNGLYDSSPGDEKDSVTTLTKGNYIASLCVATSSLEPLYCNDAVTGSIPAIKNLTISFIRPKQIAHIYVNGSSATDYVTACVQVNSLAAAGKSFTKSITVYKSGLIAKKNGPCK